MGQTKEEFLKIIPVLNGAKKAAGLMKLFSRKIRFELAGEEKAFTLEIDKGQMKLAENGAGEADIVVTGDGNAFARVISAGVDVTHPIARGQISITKGKISEMTLLNRILWSTKGSA